MTRFWFAVFIVVTLVASAARADDALFGPVSLAPPPGFEEVVIVDTDFSSGLPSGMSFTTIGSGVPTTNIVGDQLQVAPNANSTGVFFRTDQSLSGPISISADIQQTGGNGNSSAGIVIGNRIFNLFFNNGSYRVFEHNPASTAGFGTQLDPTSGNIATGNSFSGPTLHTFEVTTDGDGIFDVTITNNDNNFQFNRQFPLDPSTTLNDENYVAGQVGLFVRDFGQQTTATFDNLLITNLQPVPPLTPEPSTLLLFGVVAAALAGWYRRRSH